MDYLDWQSSISVEQVFSGADGFSHPTIVKDIGTLFLTSLKAQKSRSALMFIAEGESDAVCITPELFSLQTKVNEYGGKPYWLNGHCLVFANASDQCLYSQDLRSLDLPPKRITAAGDTSNKTMFTDVHCLNDRCAVAIVERQAKPENTMSIAALTFDNISEPIDLIHGADFYSNLVFDASSMRIAWVQWSHPNMPWDENYLHIAQLQFNDDKLTVMHSQRIEFVNELARCASVCQLIFANDGNLFFSADFELESADNVGQDSRNYWNVYQYDVERKTITAVTHGQSEYGYPHWVYGDHRIVQLDQQHLLAVASLPTGDALTLINQHSLTVEEMPIHHSTLQHLSADGSGKVVLIQLPKEAKSRLLELEFNNSTIIEREILNQGCRSDDPVLSQDCLSEAEHITFATADGQHAHGFFYPATNNDFQKQTNDSAKPPLLIMVHGGPTARAYGHFDIQKQFWTSRGFAVLDVNHRGSSGYGRAFRDALYGEWGNIDTRDIIDGIEHLVSLNKVDQRRVCIRGKSAGGYAVLRALTEYPDSFKAGACYYGIGNLVTLAESTHKFEKHYTDRLIDEVFNANNARKPNSHFYQRSPINKVDQVGSAMIVFQGSLDKVVPPSVALEVVNALKEAGLDHEYIEYPDEAHGFRQVSNNIDAWTKELAFYRRVLNSK